MWSKEVAKNAVLEVLVRSAAEEDVSDGLSLLPTLAARAGDVRVPVDGFGVPSSTPTRSTTSLWTF